MRKKSGGSNTKLSFLDTFMLQKMKDYMEPSRKGTPKGQPIGFSRKKYYAALLSLKKIPLKQQSEMLDMSHGLLRKWRTEDSFKEQIRKIETDFIAKLVDHLGVRGEMQKNLAEDYFKNSIEYITENPPPDLTWNEFNDVNYYNPHLVATIIVTFPIIYESVINRINEITSDCSISQSEENRLLYAVYAQVENFLNLLKWYPYKKKDKPKIVEEFKTRADKIKELYYRATLTMIGHDWEESGNVSEFTLKRAVWVLHNSSGSFTPVEFKY